jgi:hypothetical protein
VVVTDDQLDPPTRIFERLRQIAGYTWDENQRPFHSTYDNWYASCVPAIAASVLLLPLSHPPYHHNPPVKVGAQSVSNVLANAHVGTSLAQDSSRPTPRPQRPRAM